MNALLLRIARSENLVVIIGVLLAAIVIFAGSHLSPAALESGWVPPATGGLSLGHGGGNPAIRTAGFARASFMGSADQQMPGAVPEPQTGSAGKIVQETR